MIKMIKKADQIEKQFNVGDKMYFKKLSHDGRVNIVEQVFGSIIKVNRVSVDMESKSGNVYRVSKKDAFVI